MKVDNYRGIKAKQRKELWFVGYYLLYSLDWLLSLCYTSNPKEAKTLVLLEKEALDKQRTQEYLKYRKKFAWGKY